MSVIALLVFPVLMAFAAASDLLTMRIPNWLVLTTAALFLPLALLGGIALPALGLHLASGVAVLAVAFAFFAFGWIGGGDAKLAAAAVLWLGPGLLLPYIVYAGLIGGGLTLVVLAYRRVPLFPLIAGTAWMARLHDSKSGVPYGIALAVAGLLVYPQSPIFRALSS